MAFVDSALVARGKGDPRTLVAPVDYVKVFRKFNSGGSCHGSIGHPFECGV